MQESQFVSILQRGIMGGLHLFSDLIGLCFDQYQWLNHDLLYKTQYLLFSMFGKKE